jgi:hypothetical protein
MKLVFDEMTFGLKALYSLSNTNTNTTTSLNHTQWNFMNTTSVSYPTWVCEFRDFQGLGIVRLLIFF